MFYFDATELKITPKSFKVFKITKKIILKHFVIFFWFLNFSKNKNEKLKWRMKFACTVSLDTVHSKKVAERNITVKYVNSLRPARHQERTPKDTPKPANNLQEMKDVDLEQNVPTSTEISLLIFYKKTQCFLRND